LKLRLSNRQIMAKIDGYLANKFECSMGEIEEELNVPLWKQREIYRAYKDYYPNLRLVDGRWGWNLRALAAVPSTSQETLAEKR